jgi:hypothetical protein
LWNYLLAFPMVPALVSMIFLFLFFSETPKALLLKGKDYESARKGIYLGNLKYFAQNLVTVKLMRI